MLPINSLTCGDPPRPIDTNLVGGISPAGTDVCPHIAIGDDRGRLAGSWSCNDPGGSGTGRANWTLRAVE